MFFGWESDTIDPCALCATDQTPDGQIAPGASTIATSYPPAATKKGASDTSFGTIAVVIETLRNAEEERVETPQMGGERQYEAWLMHTNVFLSFDVNKNYSRAPLTPKSFGFDIICQITLVQGQLIVAGACVGRSRRSLKRGRPRHDFQQREDGVLCVGR